MCKFIINKFIFNLALICLPLTFGVAYADDATAPTTAPTQAPVLPSTDEQSPLQHMRDEANPPPNYISEDPNATANGNYPPPPPPSSNVEIINPSSTPNVDVQAPDVNVDSDYYGGYGYGGYGYGYDRNRGDRLERHNDNYNSERREQYNEQQMRQQEHRQEQQHHEQQQHHESEHRSGGGHMGGGGHGGGGRR